jgi:hypothetical protein
MVEERSGIVGVVYLFNAAINQPEPLQNARYYPPGVEKRALRNNFG